MSKNGQESEKQWRWLFETNAAGWYGTAAIMLAYLFVSFNIISAHSVVYQLLNLTGAIGIIVISWVKNVRQSVTLNLFWAAIALVALVRIVVT